MDDAVSIVICKIVDDKIVLAVREEQNGNSMDIKRTILNPDDVKSNYFKNYQDIDLYFEENESEEEASDVITVKKIEEDTRSLASPIYKLNIPTLNKCQNCETNFPTKYQYQRHQCDFNAENFIFKSTEEMDQDSNNKELYECNVCRKLFTNKDHMARHQECNHSDDTNYQCEFCFKNFVSENRLRIHKENHCKKAGGVAKFYRSDITIWKCKNCQEIFSSLLNAQNHQSSCQESKENIDTKYIEMASTEILLQCEFCNRTYIDKNFLLMHQRQHSTAKNFECVNCNKVFDSYSLALPHWMKQCSEFNNVFYLAKLTYCEFCDRTFKNHDLLYNHKIKKKHYTPKLHKANFEQDQSRSDENKDIMNKLIQDVLETLEVPNNIEITVEENIIEQFIKKEPENDDQTLKTPKKRKAPKIASKNKKYCITTDEGFRYQCERCVKVFDCIDNLETHRQNEHYSTFSCDTCEEKFESAKALLTHTRSHKSLKPYVCDICGRSYSQTSHLWQHMRFHQGIKPFACPHEGCEARYTIRPDLKDHIRKVHTRERPFKCNVCNKCFLTGSVYYQHRLIHTNDRRYGCDMCDKRFFRADALNNHRRIHTNERPYPCNLCGKNFRQKGDRNKHVRTQHPNVFNAHI